MLRYGYHRLKENPFTDVEKKDWFCNDVLYVYDKGLMVGINDTTFAHNTITNRAMIVGTFDGRLAPQATASHAEAAAILHRFTKN